MAETRFTFEGLDDISRRIHKAADRVAYLVVHDRTERGRDVPLGRFDLEGEEAADPVGVEDAMRWVRELAVSNTVGEDWRRFRVKAFGPKGLRLVTCGQFVCRAVRDEAAAVPPEGVLQAVVAEMRASGATLDRLVVAVIDERVRLLGPAGERAA